MAARPQLWVKRLQLTVDDSAVALPFPSDDPPEVGIKRMAEAPQLVAGTIANFRVDIDTASTGDWTFTIMHATGVGTAASTGITVTIPAGSTTATYTASSFHFAYLDRLRMDIACTPGASAKPWTFTLEFTPDVAGERSYGGGHANPFGDALDPVPVYKQNPFFPRTVTWGDQTLEEFESENCPIGQDGTITQYLCYYQIQITSGEYEFAMYKCPAADDPSDIANYVKQDGSGGTVDTRVRLNNTSPTIVDSGGNIRSYCLATFNMPVVKGDFVYITVQRLSGTTFPTDSVGLKGVTTLKFLATDTSMWFISGANFALGGVFANFITPIGDRTLVDSSTTTTKINMGPFGETGAIFNGLIFWLKDDPGAGNDRTFELFNGGVVSDIVAVVNGTDKSGDDDGTALVIEGNSFYTKHTPNGFPDDNVKFWFTYFGTSEIPNDNTIIVIKQTVPDGLAQAFDFTTAGGLTPSTFQLTDGQMQTFASLPPGTYGITETGIDGYSTIYNVSDGSPHGSIVIADGETVTVTVTNTLLFGSSGCPGDDFPIGIALGRPGCPSDSL